MADIDLNPIKGVPITQLLERWAKGDKLAPDKLAKAMQPSLHRAAVQALRSNPVPSLDPSPEALVQEAWLKVLGTPEQPLKKHFGSREHFFGYAVSAMQSLLKDRYRANQRHGAPQEPAPPEPGNPADTRSLGIQHAMAQLRNEHPRQSAAIFLAKVMGYTLEEIAEELQIATSTARTDVLFASNWLKLAVRK